MNQESVLRTLFEVKDILQELKPHPRVSETWIPRPEIMKFFGYGDTQMAEFEKKHQLVCSKVGKRKFYHKKSVADLLDKMANHDLS